MGNCFSITTRRGRKKIHIGIVHRSFTSNGKSSVVSSQKTASSKNVEEYAVEPASGLFSVGSDFSGLCIGAQSDVEKPQQKFAWHLAQEKKMESLEKARSPSDRTRETTRSLLDRSNGKKGSPLDRSKEKEGSPFDRSKEKKGSPFDRSNEKKGSPFDRSKEKKGSPFDRSKEKKGSPFDRSKEKKGSPFDRSKEKKGSPLDRSKERKRESPARPPGMLAKPTTANGLGHLKYTPSRKSVERKLASDYRRSVDSKDWFDRNSLDSKPSETKPVGRKSADSLKPSEKVSVERKPSETASVESKSPEIVSVERKSPEIEGTYGDNSNDRRSSERTAAVVEALNRKGRQALDRARGHTSYHTNGVKRSRSRNGKEREGHDVLPGPVDFGFLAKRFVNENSNGPSKFRKDGEISVLADQKDPAVPSLVRKDSLSRQEIDEVMKSYRESAAKAAARDRDSFKSMAIDDMSFSSSHGGSNKSDIGSSPAFKPRRTSHSKSASQILAEPRNRIGTSPPIRPRKTSHSKSSHLLAEPEREMRGRPTYAGSLRGTSPTVKPWKASHSRSASFFVETEQEIEQEIMESPANLATLLRDADMRLRERARGPSLPKPLIVSRNKSYPSQGMNRSHLSPSTNARPGESPSPGVREGQGRQERWPEPLPLAITAIETPE